MRAYGAEVVVCPTAVPPDHPDSYYSVSDRLVAEIDGAWKPDQYSNPNGPASHYETTGPEIWADTDGKVTHFVAGVGTGGTITGAGRYLKEVSGGRSEGPVRVVGADPEGSVYSGGTGRPYLVEGVGEDFWPTAYDRSVPDEIIAVSDADSFEMTRRLAREEALLVGGSCGMAVVAALKVAERAGPDALVVVLLPDGGRGYLSKIFNDDVDVVLRFPAHPPGRVGNHESTVGDVLRGKSGALPDLVHTHPSETIRDAIGILREYGVSQMPVVGAEPPVMAGEVAGSVSERELLSAVFEGRAKLADAVAQHMSPPLPLIGAGELVGTAAKVLRECDALMVVEEGKPVGVITRAGSARILVWRCPPDLSIQVFFLVRVFEALSRVRVSTVLVRQPRCNKEGAHDRTTPAWSTPWELSAAAAAAVVVIHRRRRPVATRRRSRRRVVIHPRRLPAVVIRRHPRRRVAVTRHRRPAVRASAARSRTTSARRFRGRGTSSARTLPH